MKKTLIALAALTAASAFAESSVTLYGSADAFFGRESKKAPAVGPGLFNKNSVTPFVKSSQTIVGSGGLSASRLGISVKEDLGNGQQAFAIIENEFQTDTGTVNKVVAPTDPTPIHRDKTVVGLSGSWGSLSLGHQPTPLKDGSDRLTDAQGDSAFSAFNRAAAVALTTTRSPYTPYINNSIRYDLPSNLDGWRGGIAIGTNKAIEAKKDHIFGFSLGYVVPGSWAVGFSHQTERNGQSTVVLPPALNGLVAALTGAPPTSILPGQQKISINYLSGAFGTPIGKFTLGLGGGKVGGVSGNDKGWNLGWTAPIDNWTLIAQVAQFKASGELGNLYNTLNALRVTPTAVNPNLRSGSAKRTSIGLEARYALSKRTTLYTGYNHTKNATGVDGAKADIFGVGMRHDF